MPDNKKNTQPPVDEAEAQDGPEMCAPETPAGPQETTPLSAEDQVAELEAQAAALKDQLLRAMAETENLRQRSRRERADAVRYATGPLVKDMIEVADNLRRALEAVPAEAVETDGHLKTLMTGVGMTEKALQTVFERHHIERLDPLGERLDPHFHEAIFEVPDPSQPAGTIVQVVRAGYRLHDRLLRAAQVGIAKGGPAAKAKEEAAPDGGDREPGAGIDTSA